MMILPLSTLRAKDQPRAGHKAAILGELLAAGMPVPGGFCLSTAVAAELRATGRLPQEVLDWLAALPQDQPYAVRSSSLHEGSSAFSGIFATVLGARGADGLVRAITEVISSAAAERAQSAYDAAQVSAENLSIPVLVQPLLASEVSGVLLSRGLQRPEQMRIESVPGAGDALVDGQAQPGVDFLHRDEGGRAPESRPHASGWLLEEDELRQLRDLARTVERILGADPVEIEWARASGGLWLLQARRTPSEAERALFLWDRGHNPAPLSEAQAHAVRALDARGKTPSRLKVVDGYLFAAPRPDARLVRPRLTPDFNEFFEEEIAPKILGPIMGEPLHLKDALQNYLRFCEEYFCGILSGPRQVLDELRAFLQQHEVWPGKSRYPAGLSVRDPVPALMPGLRTKTFRKEAALYAAAQLAKRSEAARATYLDGAPPGEDHAAKNVQAILAEFLAIYGDEAPAWDLSYKSLREDAAAWRALREARLTYEGASPEERRRKAGREAAQLAASLSEALPEEARAAFADKLSYARLLYPLLEEDDLLFSKAQNYLRRAYLQAAAKLGLADPEDVFWLTWDEVSHKIAPSEAAQRARERRAVWRQRASRPPLPIGPSDPHQLRGEGASPGLARGPVRVLTDFSSLRLVPGEILVVPALVPSLSQLLVFAAGLVAEHGGALSHAAAMAREYGIPAVVGATNATRLLRDGQIVLVDGDTGRIQLEEARAD